MSIERLSVNKFEVARLSKLKMRFNRSLHRLFKTGLKFKQCFASTQAEITFCKNLIIIKKQTMMFLSRKVKAVFFCGSQLRNNLF